MKKFGVVLIIALFLALVIHITYVSAAGLSINKAVLDFRNVLKGGYAEDTIYVAADTDFDVPITYEILKSDIQTWISFEPDINTSNATLYVSSTHAQPLKVILQPPADTPTGNYTGNIRVLTGTFNRPGGPYGSQLQAAFIIRIGIEVVGTQVISCNVGGINIPDTEIGSPIGYSMTIDNTGNVRIRPNVTIDFWNQDQTKLVFTRDSQFSNTEVLPTTARTLSATFDNTLRIGQYWAYATIAPCNDTRLLSFSVFEKGSIVDTGELIRIENKPWASIDEIVPITAYFKNTGSRVVSAKLKGIITKDNAIVQNIDSEFYDIAPGETYNITVYFSPKSLGQYYVSGRVLYNNKLSFEKSSILNVNSGVEKTGFNMTYVLILIVVIIVILVLLVLIKRRKGHHRR